MGIGQKVKEKLGMGTEDAAPGSDKLGSSYTNVGASYGSANTAVRGWVLGGQQALAHTAG